MEKDPSRRQAKAIFSALAGTEGKQVAALVIRPASAAARSYNGIGCAEKQHRKPKNWIAGHLTACKPPTGAINTGNHHKPYCFRPTVYACADTTSRTVDKLHILRVEFPHTFGVVTFRAEPETVIIMATVYKIITPLHQRVCSYIITRRLRPPLSVRANPRRLPPEKSSWHLRPSESSAGQTVISIAPSTLATTRVAFGENRGDMGRRLKLVIVVAAGLLVEIGNVLTVCKPFRQKLITVHSGCKC